MANIRADVPWSAQAYLCVQVSPIHVNLASMGMNNFADFANRFLKYSMGGGIGHHQGCQFIAVCAGFGPQVLDINVAIFVTGDRQYRQTGHNCAGRIGSVSRVWNETYSTFFL